jgi:hypothetical protein
MRQVEKKSYFLFYYRKAWQFIYNQRYGKHTCTVYRLIGQQWLSFEGQGLSYTLRYGYGDQ